MEKVLVQAEFLFELISKQDWVNNVPKILPKKKHLNEQWLWIDKNGHIMQRGADFSAAERLNSYPCKVYRLVTVSEFESQLIT